jgi:bifunctional ADP-heptose synthase (sugar kinase/adenylyltransferase)
MMSRVLVIGETCTDIFVYGSSERKSPEGNGPVFVPISETYGLGMASNVMNNLKGMGIDTDLFSDNGSIVKTRYVNINTNELYLRVDENDLVNRIDIDKLSNINEYDAIIISDYCKGFLNEEDISNIASKHPFVVLDTKKKLGDWCKDLKFIKINRLEWEGSKDVIRDNEWLFDKIICTLDKTGTAYKHTTYPVIPIENADVSGAGDTFTAGFVVKYLETGDIGKSIEWGNYCACEVVKQKGVSVFKK